MNYPDPWQFRPAATPSCRQNVTFLTLLRLAAARVLRHTRGDLPAARSNLLQGIEERKQCSLVLGAQFAEAIPNVFGLAFVTFDGVLQSQ